MTTFAILRKTRGSPWRPCRTGLDDREARDFLTDIADTGSQNISAMSAQRIEPDAGGIVLYRAEPEE